jgi:DNA phosphorothioation-dependent restriction protein DptG
MQSLQANALSRTLFSVAFVGLLDGCCSLANKSAMDESVEKFIKVRSRASLPDVMQQNRRCGA